MYRCVTIPLLPRGCRPRLLPVGVEGRRAVEGVHGAVLVHVVDQLVQVAVPAEAVAVTAVLVLVVKGISCEGQNRSDQKDQGGRRGREGAPVVSVLVLEVAAAGPKLVLALGVRRLRQSVLHELVHEGVCVVVMPRGVVLHLVAGTVEVNPSAVPATALAVERAGEDACRGAQGL